jgi:hypothetical protein
MDYSFPLTDNDKLRARKLMQHLEQNDNGEKTRDSFHQFIKPFLYPLLESQSHSRWDDPVECFMAVYCLNEDGNFKPARNTSQLFTHLKYHTRGAIFYEGFKAAGGHTSRLKLYFFIFFFMH